MEEMESCLSPAAQDLAEARLAAKRAARAEAREIRMKELERQQKEVEERPDKDFNEKGARTASSLSAATLASLGGSSSRRGSGDTSISVETEASIREIKDSLAEVEEKYKKAMVSNAQLDNEKTNFMYQVDTLKDVLLELEEQLAETHRQYEEKSKEFEREKHSHRILQIQYNEMKESLQQKEEMLTRHGIVLSSDLSPNGGTFDGPRHEGLVDSSTLGSEDTTPGLKTTSDGPLGRANEVKMKNEKMEKDEEFQSSETLEHKEETGVLVTPKVQIGETTLHSEAGGAGDSHKPIFVSTDTLEEKISAAGIHVSKRDSYTDGDNIDRSGKGFDPCSFKEELGNSSGDTTEGLIVQHVEKTATLQGQRGLEIKGECGHLQENEKFEVQVARERESCSEMFLDAMEFVGQKTSPSASRDDESYIQDEYIGVTIDKASAGLLTESQEKGFHVQGVLQELGRHLDGIFDTVSNNESSNNAMGPMGGRSQQQNMEEGVEVKEWVSTKVPEGDGIGLSPSEVTVNVPGMVAGTKEGAIVSEELIGSSVDANVHGGGSSQDQAGRHAPVGGEQSTEAEITQTHTSSTQGSRELKSDEEESDVESVGSKPHSEDGEFYECPDEDTSSEVGASNTGLGEEWVKSSQELSPSHHEGTEASVQHSNHTKEEELCPVTSQLCEEELGKFSDVNDGMGMASREPVLVKQGSGQAMEDIQSTELDGNRQQAAEAPSQLVQGNDNGVESCTAQTKSDDEKDQRKQGGEGNKTPVEEKKQTLEETADKCGLQNLEPQRRPEEVTMGLGWPDDHKANMDEEACETVCKVGHQECKTPDEDGDSFDDEGVKRQKDGKSLMPTPAEAKECGKEDENELQMGFPAQMVVTQTLDQDHDAIQIIQNKDTLAKGEDNHQGEGELLGATEHNPNVASPHSAETSSNNLGEDTEQSTESTGVENSSIDSASQPGGLENTPTYSKEDTLDRDIKRGKGKNKEDCLLS